MYSHWDYEPNKAYIQSNYYAGFPAEFLIPFPKISEVHTMTALSEVRKQKMVYKLCVLCVVHLLLYRKLKID